MPVKINISGDVSYAKDIPTSLAAKIIHFIENSEDGSSGVGIVQTDHSRTLVSSRSDVMFSPQQTPREAIFASGASTNAEKITALVGYLSARDGAAASVKEVQELFRKAGEPLPKNFSRDINDAVRLAYIYDETRGRFALSDSGRAVLNSGFKNHAAETRLHAKTKNGGSPKKKKTYSFGLVREQVAKLEATTEGWDGIPGFHAVPTKTKKILWLLTLAKKNSLNGLSSREIEHLALRLGERIPVHHVSVFTEGEVKKGHINPPNNQDLWVVLKKGEDALHETGEKQLKKK